jgi:hypothetical protein
MLKYEIFPIVLFRIHKTNKLRPATCYLLADAWR